VLLFWRKEEIILNIGDRIKEIRKENGNMSMEKFGKMLGVGKSTVSNWENGTNVPNNMIVSICREFGYNEEWIKNGAQPKKLFDKVTAYLGQIDKGNDEFIKDLIVAYMELDPDSKKALQVLTEKMYQNRKERGQ
jgi:transcriptional regulator with XRE-family HTH domain